jgi:hypothetical protein
MLPSSRHIVNRRTIGLRDCGCVGDTPFMRGFSPPPRSKGHRCLTACTGRLWRSQHVAYTRDLGRTGLSRRLYKTRFPVRSTSLLSRPDLALPEPRRATKGKRGAEAAGATHSAPLRACLASHQTFPAVRTVAHSAPVGRSGRRRSIAADRGRRQEAPARGALPGQGGEETTAFLYAASALSRCERGHNKGAEGYVFQASVGCPPVE